MLTLDTILSAMSFHVRKWSPDLARTQARDLLRYLVMRLHSEGKGTLNAGSLTISQSALADHLGITREWCNKLLANLKADGWLIYSSGRRKGGLRTTCSFAIGNTLKRLLIALSKSKTKKKRVVKSRSQAFPFSVKKYFSSIREEGKVTISLEALQKIPLLGKWMERK